MKSYTIFIFKERQCIRTFSNCGDFEKWTLNNVQTQQVPEIEKFLNDEKHMKLVRELDIHTITWIQFLSGFLRANNLETHLSMVL